MRYEQRPGTRRRPVAGEPPAPSGASPRNRGGRVPVPRQGSGEGICMPGFEKSEAQAGMSPGCCGYALALRSGTLYLPELYPALRQAQELARGTARLKKRRRGGKCARHSRRNQRAGDACRGVRRKRLAGVFHPDAAQGSRGGCGEQCPSSNFQWKKHPRAGYFDCLAR